MRLHETECSGRAFAQLRDEPFDGPGQQELPRGDGQQVIVGSHRSSSIEVARRRAANPVDEHQPPEMPLARPAQRPHTLDLQFAGVGPLDADHAVTADQRGKFRDMVASVEHHDHFVTRIFGGEEVFDLRRVRYAAAQDRNADTIGSVAGGRAHGIEQQAFVPGTGYQQQQCAYAHRHRNEHQEKNQLHARQRL